MCRFSSPVGFLLELFILARRENRQIVISISKRNREHRQFLLILLILLLTSLWRKIRTEQMKYDSETNRGKRITNRNYFWNYLLWLDKRQGVWPKYLHKCSLPPSSSLWTFSLVRSFLASHFSLMIFSFFWVNFLCAIVVVIRGWLLSLPNFVIFS